MNLKSTLWKLISALFFLTSSASSILAQSSAANALQPPRDQIALQLGAIQMGYDVPFVLSGSISPEKMQQAVNALVMGRNSLNATLTAPAVQVQGAVDCPNVNTMEYRDQLYLAVEYVVTSPVVATIKGSAYLANSKKVNVSATKLSVPSQVWTIPVPYALEARTSVESVDLGDSTPTSTGSTQLAALSQNVTALTAQVASLVSNFGNSTQSVESLSQNLTALQTQVSSLSGNSTTASAAELAANFIHFKNSLVSAGVGRDFERSLVTTLADSASFGFIHSLTLDSAGNIYVLDAYKIWKVTPAGVLTTLAGSGSPGSADGTGAAASFGGSYMSGLTIDTSGNLYFIDGTRIRKVTPEGQVTTLAGSGSSGSVDGIGSSARFGSGAGSSIATDSFGNIYVADRENFKIRKVTPNGLVSTLAGSGIGSNMDGTGVAASFGYIDKLTIDAEGNIYVRDGSKIRKVSQSGVVTTLGNLDGFSGSIVKMVTDKSGNLYVLYSEGAYGSYIVKVTSTGLVSKLAGKSTSNSKLKDGVGQNAYFGSSSHLTIDSNGNLYTRSMSSFSSIIRKVTPAGVVSTLAGAETSRRVYSDDAVDGYAYDAVFSESIEDIAVDPSGNVYVADAGARKIRKITISQ